MKPTLEDAYALGLERNLFTSKEAALQARPDLKRWVEALETTTLKQAKGVLVRCTTKGKPTSACCLGVACLSAGLEGKRLYDCLAFYDSSSYLAPEVQGPLAVQSSSGKWDGPPIGTHRTLTALTALNDRARWPFPTIAAFIKGSYRGLTGEDL